MCFGDLEMIKKRMMKRRKKLLSTDEEIDPMIYAVNMVDCMLVLAVGFLIFTIMSMGLQNVVFSDMKPQEKSDLAKKIKQSVQVTMGQEINNTPISQQGGTNGYVDVGRVYKDPKTGKLIMVKDS
jgi:hypothetical protein